MGTIIGRSFTPLNSSRTLGSVRGRDDNSRAKVQNVREDSSVQILKVGEIVIGKRFETRAQAVHWADLVRGDLEKGAE